MDKYTEYRQRPDPTQHDKHPAVRAVFSLMGANHFARQLGLAAENFIDLFRQLKIQVADSLHTMAVQVDYHFVPYIEPFRMMVHPLGHQRHLRHLPESGYEILALKFFV